MRRMRPTRPARPARATTALAALMTSAALLLPSTATAAAPPAPPAAPPGGASATAHTAGRVEATADGSLAYSWPGVYFEGRFRGTGVGIVLDDSAGDYDIAVDGKTVDTLVTPGKTTHWVDGLRDGGHSVRVVKRNESPWATSYVRRLRRRPWRPDPAQAACASSADRVHRRLLHGRLRQRVRVAGLHVGPGQPDHQRRPRFRCAHGAAAQRRLPGQRLLRARHGAQLQRRRAGHRATAPTTTGRCWPTAATSGSGHRAGVRSWS